MLSRYYHSYKVEAETYAIYNSLLMEVLYVTLEELEAIENGTVESEEMIRQLFDAGIYVINSSVDDEALNFYKSCHASTSGMVDIMYLITTQKCNLKCTYCFLENNPNKDISLPYMTNEIAIGAIKKFAEYLLKNKKEKATIIFYGGEPLLQKEVIFTAVTYARRYPIKWDFSIITNGTLLDEETANFCSYNNVTIGLSVDGPEFLHNLNRRYRMDNRPSYDDCMNSKKLLDKYRCSYGLSITLSKDTIKYKDKLVEWLFENYEGDVYFNLLHFSSEDVFSRKYIEEASKFMVEFYEKCELNGFKIKEGRIHRQIESFIERKFVFSDCGAVGCHQITVVPNGQLCICHGDSGNTKYHFGMLEDLCISEIQKTEQGKAWRNYSTLNDDECLKCPAIFCCGRGCPQHAENLFGNREYKDENFCVYIRNILNWLLNRGYYMLYDDKGGE